MQIEVQQSDFQTALAAASRVAKASATMPTLASVYLDAGDRHLRIIGADREIAIAATIEAHVSGPGTALLPAKPLYELVRRLPDVPVVIEADGPHATVMAGMARYRLHGIAPSAFPRPEPIEGAAATIPAAVLAAIARRVAPFASLDVSRPILTGVHVRGGMNGLHAIATDGVRVAALHVPDVAAPIQATIPGRAIVEAGRLIGVQEVAIRWDDSRMALRGGGIEVIAQLLDGTYPDVMRILPDEYPTRITVERDALAAGIERAAVVARQSTRGVPVVLLSIEPGRIVIEAEVADVGTAREEVESRVIGEGMVIGFNAGYLLDGLKTIEAEEVEIGFIDAEKPARLQGVGEAAYWHVVFPVRLQ